MLLTKRWRWSVVGVVAAQGCGEAVTGGDPGQDAPPEEMIEVGDTVAAVLEVPPAVNCIRVNIENLTTNLVTRKKFDVVPDQTTAHLDLGMLPANTRYAFSGDAFESTCSSVGNSSPARWTAPAVYEWVLWNQPTAVTLSFVRNDNVDVTANFVRPIASVAMSSYGTYVLLQDGSLYAAGDPLSGTFFQDEPADPTRFVEVTPLAYAIAESNGSTVYYDEVLASPRFVSIAGVGTTGALGRGWCGVSDLGSLYCWGSLGFATSFNDLLSPHEYSGVALPYPHLGAGAAAEVALGEDLGGANFGCASLTDGRIACFGDNSFGQSFPGQYPGGYSDVDFAVFDLDRRASGPIRASSWTGPCALTTAGAVECWGDVYGWDPAPRTIQAPGGGPLWPVAKIEAGRGHVCALRVVPTYSSVHCWGENTYGQLGSEGPGTVDAVWSPVTPDGEALDLAVSGDTTCAAVRPWAYQPSTASPVGSGEVRCWGGSGLYTGASLGNGWDVGDYDGYTQVNVATPAGHVQLTDARRIWGAASTGYDAFCAERATTGELVCWGANPHGNLGTGSYDDAWVATPVLGL